MIYYDMSCYNFLKNLHEKIMIIKVMQLIHTLQDNRESTIQLNTLYKSILSLIGRHLPRMALEMALTRVKFSLPYISPKT